MFMILSMLKYKAVPGSSPKEFIKLVNKDGRDIMELSLEGFIHDFVLGY